MEDGRIDENMLALSIGLTTTGVYGLARAANSEQWCSDKYHIFESTEGR